jgi:hypothetical protein
MRACPGQAGSRPPRSAREPAAPGRPVPGAGHLAALMVPEDAQGISAPADPGWMPRTHVARRSRRVQRSPERPATTRAAGDRPGVQRSLKARRQTTMIWPYGHSVSPSRPRACSPSRFARTSSPTTSRTGPLPAISPSSPSSGASTRCSSRTRRPVRRSVPSTPAWTSPGRSPTRRRCRCSRPARRSTSGSRATASSRCAPPPGVRSTQDGRFSLNARSQLTDAASDLVLSQSGQPITAAPGDTVKPTSLGVFNLTNGHRCSTARVWRAASAPSCSPRSTYATATREAPPPSGSPSVPGPRTPAPFGLAQVAAATGAPEDAILFAQAALGLDPSFPGPRELIALLQRSAGTQPERGQMIEAPSSSRRSERLRGVQGTEVHRWPPSQPSIRRAP